jgi:hypothetical protein
VFVGVMACGRSGCIAKRLVNTLLTALSTILRPTGAVDDIKMVMLAPQLVVLILIASITYEDSQAMKADAAVEAAKVALQESSFEDC